MERKSYNSMKKKFQKLIYYVGRKKGGKETADYMRQHLIMDEGMTFQWDGNIDFLKCICKKSRKSYKSYKSRKCRKV